MPRLARRLAGFTLNFFPACSALPLICTSYRPFACSRYSIFQDEASEAEVLLYPGTKLKVVDAMEMGGGLFQVHLREVPVPVQLMK